MENSLSYQSTLQKAIIPFFRKRHNTPSSNRTTLQFMSATLQGIGLLRNVSKFSSGQHVAPKTVQHHSGPQGFYEGGMGCNHRSRVEDWWPACLIG
uniref:Uncharacterized protein n=1 Tax=Caenorhabditis japonica TaxID=281687 RepID=A0A8R1EM66_CAEJA